MPSERRPFLLRIDPSVLEAMQRWASDDLRSLNGQIEYVLRLALVEGGRLKAGRAGGTRAAGEERRRRPPSGGSS